MPNVSIELGKKIKVENTDNIIEISGQGKLIFSKGSVEWKPIKNSVNQLKFSWPEFAKALETSGTPVRKVPAKKAAAAKKAPAKAAPAKTPAVAKKKK